MKQLDVLQPQSGIKRYFQVQLFSFACIGVNVLSLERTMRNPLKFWFLTLSAVGISFLILLYAIENISDLDKATHSLLPFWQFIISIFKVLHFKWNSKKIIAVIKKLWLWNLEAKGKDHEILAAENRKDVLFCTFYHLAVATTGLLGLLAPVVIAAFYGWQGENYRDYLEAPTRATYFIDKKSLFGYIIVYIWNVFCTFSLIYGSVSTDSLFSWFTCNIVAHFEILKYRLRQAGGQQNGYCLKKTICDCIAYHSRTLELARQFNDAFRVVVFIKFTISCVQICCLTFQLSRGGELFDHVFHAFFLMAVSMQLFLYCYGGQRIQNESISVANEIYESFHWELLTLENRKMLVFSMKRSQVACCVSGIFFTANMSLFLWVYRTAASLNTLLLTLEEKDHETK